MSSSASSCLDWKMVFLVVVEVVVDVVAAAPAVVAMMMAASHLSLGLSMAVCACG